MKILGVDPGYERIGFAVITKVGSKVCLVEAGLIETPRIEKCQRYRILFEEIQKVLERHSPDQVATERLLFAANKTTAIDVAGGLGVILLATAQAGVPWNEFTPPEIKQAVTGVGNADKKQVQFMVAKLLGLEKAPKPDDVADACAIAICAGFRGLTTQLTLR